MAKKTEKENKEPNKNKKKIMSEPIHHDTALAIEIIKTAPKNREFYLVDGRKLKDLRELALSLGDLPDQAFWHHVNDARNDFANWIEEIFEEKELARTLRATRSKLDSQIAILRHLVSKIR